MRWKGTSPVPFDKSQGFRKLFASGLKVFYGLFQKLRGIFLSRVVKLMGKIAHFGGVLPVVVRHVFQQRGYLGQIRRGAVVVGMAVFVMMIAMPVGMILSVIVSFMQFFHVLPPD
jgi:hypothetical protein